MPKERFRVTAEQLVRMRKCNCHQIILNQFFVSDGTGAQWCYVDSAHSSCQDLVPSQRFPNNPWSYEACATPSIGSPLCPVAPASVVVPAVPVAPVAPVAPQHPTYPLPAAPTDLHPVAPQQPEVIIGQGPGFGVGPNTNYDPESIGDIRLGDASSKSKFKLKIEL